MRSNFKSGKKLSLITSLQSSFVLVQTPWEAFANPEDAKSVDDSPVLFLPPLTLNQSVDHEYNVEMADCNDNHADYAETTPPVFSGRKRLASGLANLGNTCFMNSSIQCLAHTGPLRRYFLSGEYIRDLNRDNPLGTGGELTTQFATLMGDMWGVSAKRRSVLGNSSASHYSDTSSAAVYPRSFKYCLGKHAEQFVGYDQHDSQELATYLLDALHEDTNRVTKKPYIEIPEQGEDEPDGVAADKAWTLHLQREDSRVLESFMGQVKSRLECCREGCNRVSTTFDPFMFLSVPIPGSTDRTLKITFVPLDPNQRMRVITLTVSKAAPISALLAKLNETILSDGVVDHPIPFEDLCVTDVWSFEVFSWYQHTAEVDRIKDSDKTFIYQLRPLSEVQEEWNPKEVPVTDDIFSQARRSRKYTLDVGTLMRLNRDDEWQTELENYVQSPTLLLSLFNPKRGTHEERLQFQKKLETFIYLCNDEISEEESTCKKRSRDGKASEEKSTDADLAEMQESLQGLLDRSDASAVFKGVRSRQDVAILEFCANKLRQYILKTIDDKRTAQKDGILIQVIMRRQMYDPAFKPFVQPLVMRIPATMTVYTFREVLARKISRSLKTPKTSGEPSAEIAKRTSTFGSPELLVLRQIALAYDRKGSYGSKSSSSTGSRLGMVPRHGEHIDGNSAPALAVATDDAEKQLLAEVVGPNGSIFVDWPKRLCDAFFDDAEFVFEELSKKPEESITGDAEGKKSVNVMDCIKKYCHKEQLEETEMWYCNKCKDHVQAWKQFHLYRTPPILIVHLKRFHYSSSTHRRNKITSFIDFPLAGLDLTDMVSNYQEGQEPVYDCYAVSNHYGNLGGGHYTAYILGDDGTWCHYDDTRVTSNVSPTEVVSEAAYVLYYRRRDVEFGDDPIYDYQTADVVVDHNETSRHGNGDIWTSQLAQDEHGVDDDDMAVDGDGSSRTGSSLISELGSVDGGKEDTKGGNVVCFTSDPDDPKGAGFLLQ